MLKLISYLVRYLFIYFYLEKEKSDKDVGFDWGASCVVS